MLLIMLHWADSRSLAATNEISFDFFSSGYLDVSVPQVRLQSLCIQECILFAEWVAPFRDLWVIALLPAHQSLSQAITSFIASYYLGIHRTHLFS